MEINIKEIGRIIKWMEMESFYLQVKEKLKKESIKMEFLLIEFKITNFIFNVYIIIVIILSLI